MLTVKIEEKQVSQKQRSMEAHNQKKISDSGAITYVIYIISLTIFVQTSSPKKKKKKRPTKKQPTR